MTAASQRERPLRLAFFGTPDYAVPTLERLVADGHALVAVVSQPDRRRGRGRKHSPSPVAEVALREGFALLRPDRVGAPDVVEALAETAPELGVVVAFGQFIPKRVRELPALGYCINGHASLLPRWRGAAPIQRAILAGDRVTGVSVMRVEREMDAGPVALRRELAIGDDEDAGSLSRRLAELTAELVSEAIVGIAAGRARFAPQPEAGVTLAPKLERGEERLDLREGAEALVRRVRAFAPSPGASVDLDGEALRILAAQVREGAAEGPVGTVRREGDEIRIATGDGWLVPRLLKRPGRRALPTADYLRGRPISDGARLSLRDD